MLTGIAIGALGTVAIAVIFTGATRPRDALKWIGDVGRRIFGARVALVVLVLTAGGVWLLVRAAKADGDHRDVWGQVIAAASLAGVTVTLYATSGRWTRTLPARGGEQEVQGNAAREPAKSAVAARKPAKSAVAARKPAKSAVAARKPAKSAGAAPAESGGPSSVAPAQEGNYFRSLIVGVDGRWSTSKFQALIWTYAVLYALVSLFVASELGLPLEIATGKTGDFGDIPFKDEYLILLGGPFAVAVLSKGIVAAKVEEGKVVKPAAPEERSVVTGFRDLISDDRERTDLVDFQYLMFNLVALGFFLVAFVPDLAAGFPDLPEFLFGLTSAAALAYVTKKAVDRSVPTIASVMPSRAFPGDKLTIHGRYLLTSGDDRPDVMLNGKGMKITKANVTPEDDAVLVVEVPRDAEPGDDQTLAVHPLGAVAPATATIEVAGVSITDVDPDPMPLKTGTSVVVTGTGFGSPRGTVELHGEELKVESWTETRIVAKVDKLPAAPPAGTKLRVKVVRRLPDDRRTALDGDHSTKHVSYSESKPSISEVDPATPQLTEGAALAIRGTGFGETGTVHLGPFNLGITAWNDSEIITSMPRAGSGASTDTMPAGKVMLMVERDGKPIATKAVDVVGITITGTDPKPLPVTPGQMLRVVGSGFGQKVGQAALTLDNTPLDGVEWADTVIIGQIPQGFSPVAGSQARLSVTHALGHSATLDIELKTT